MKRRMTEMAVLMLLVFAGTGCARVATDENPAEEKSMFAGFFGSDRYTLPANTSIPVRLTTDIASDTATVGQPVQGEVVSDITVDGRVVIPAGAPVTGGVSAVKPAKRFGGQAMVAIEFASVKLPDGDSVPVDGSVAAYAKKETAKDTGTIVGGTVGGAILGRIVGKDSSDAVKGGVIGGGIGTAIASRKGDDAHLPIGTTTKVLTSRRLELAEVA